MTGVQTCALPIFCLCLNRLQKEYPQADVSDLLEQKEKAKAQKQQLVVYEMEPEDKDRRNE